MEWNAMLCYVMYMIYVFYLYWCINASTRCAPELWKALQRVQVPKEALEKGAKVPVSRPGVGEVDAAGGVTFFRWTMRNGWVLGTN